MFSKLLHRIFLFARLPGRHSFLLYLRGIQSDLCIPCTASLRTYPQNARHANFMLRKRSIDAYTQQAGDADSSERHFCKQDKV